MLCSEFDARMQSLLDQRRAPELDPVLLDHAQGCSSCHAQLTTLTRLLDALDLLEVPELPPEFAQGIVDAVHQPVRTTSPTKPIATWWLAVAVLAATLLLAALPVTWYAINHHRKVAQPRTQIQPFAGQDATVRHTAPSPLDGTDEGWLVSSSILELYPEETRQRHRQQVHRIADDLRPIATPFNATMTAIRRSLPVGRTQTKGEPRASLIRCSVAHDIS